MKYYGKLKSEGKLLADAMEDIYKKYGYYKEELYTITMKGKEGSEQIAAITAKMPITIFILPSGKYKFSNYYTPLSPEYVRSDLHLCQF